MARTKKTKHAGRFGTGYGTRARKKLNEIESVQRKKQVCPFCMKGRAVREAVGIWSCKKCNKKFAGPAYAINK